jgi:adenylate cyclase
VVGRIANSLRVELVSAESHRSRPQNLDAVDLTMRGWDLLWRSQTRETNRAARDFFEQAVKLDPTNAEAYGGIAYSRARDFVNGWAEPGAEHHALVIEPADRALAINPGNGMAAYAKGLFLTVSGHSAEAKTVVQVALQHNPSLAPLYLQLGLIHTASGDYEQAKADIKQALRLSPRDPQIGLWEFVYGRADLGLGRYGDAIDEEHRAMDDGFMAYWPHEVLTAAYSLSGQDKEARAELAEATRLNPKITSIKSLTPLDAGIPRLVEGLRKAGMPEE